MASDYHFPKDSNSVVAGDVEPLVEPEQYYLRQDIDILATSISSTVNSDNPSDLSSAQCEVDNEEIKSLKQLAFDRSINYTSQFDLAMAIRYGEKQSVSKKRSKSYSYPLQLSTTNSSTVGSSDTSSLSAERYTYTPSHKTFKREIIPLPFQCNVISANQCEKPLQQILSKYISSSSRLFRNVSLVSNLSFLPSQDLQALHWLYRTSLDLRSNLCTKRF